jgi:hypothetical protein
MFYLSGRNKKMKRNIILKKAAIFVTVTTILLSNVVVTADTSNKRTISIDNNISLGGNQYIDLEIINVQGGFGKITAVIKNNGTTDALNVEWSISVKGGILGLINVETTDIVPVMVAGESFNIETDKLIFGLGPVEILIEALFVTSEGTGFVLGPFLINLQTTMVPVVTPWDFGRSESGGFYCTLHMDANDWAVWITKIEWTFATQVIYTREFPAEEGACAAGKDFDLPTMYVSIEPNDFIMYWKAVKGGTFADVTDPDVEPQTTFFVIPQNFKWRKPYPTNPEENP